jgi:methanol--5-hydroxybenzimidazolylcobamide Co-methyltransferase
MREGMDREHSYPEKIFESLEVAAKNGADLLSIESVGGKEMSDYAVIRQDIRAWLFGTSYLGSIDMEWLWPQIVEIAKRNKVIPAGDTNCAGANTAMFLAGGYMDKDIPRTFTAITRAISATKTLVAYECGALGPNKDCGYEGPILKAISGRASSQEGKNAQCAHSDLMGNLMAHTCDLWSNESVEYHSEFGGSSVACWLGALGYEASFMNASKLLNKDKDVRDIYMASDRYRSPEGYILCYDNAYQIGRAIVENGKDRYLRAKAAGIKAAELVQDASIRKKLQLNKHEEDTLRRVITDLKALPDEETTFLGQCLKEYKDVKAFDPRNYDL